LKLECDELLSSFAFKFNLRRYTVVTIIEMRDVAQVVLSRHPIDANLAAFLRSRGKDETRVHNACR
jgi:hypothetical protein